jgi:hypothetical protein
MEKGSRKLAEGVREEENNFRRRWWEKNMVFGPNYRHLPFYVLFYKKRRKKYISFLRKRTFINRR